MSQTLQLQKAQHEYQEFIRHLSAFRACNLAIHDLDPPIEPFIEISRSDALNAFLKNHPECNEFREQLLHVRGGQKKFFFIEDRWKEL